MEYVRACWNERRGATEFRAGVPAGAAVSVFAALVELVSAEEPHSLLIGYCSAMLSDATTAAAVFTNTSGLNIDGLIHAVAESDAVFIRNERVGNESAALSAIGALNIVLKAPKEAANKAIRRLCKHNVFPLHVAASRPINAESVQKASEVFNSIFVLEDDDPPAVELLQKVMSGSVKPTPVVMIDVRIMPYVIVGHLITNSSPSFSSFADIDWIQEELLRGVAEMMRSPSLLLAYVLFHDLPHICGLSIDKLISALPNSEIANAKSVLMQIPQNSTLEVVANCISYPSRSSSLVEQFQTYFATTANELKNYLITQAMSNLTDFVVLLLRQNRYIDFLQYVLESATNIQCTITPVVDFNNHWFFGLSLLVYGYGLGKSAIRRKISEFVLALNEPGMREFLMHLLNPSIRDMIQVQFLNTNTYYSQMIIQFANWLQFQKLPDTFIIPQDNSELYVLPAILVGLMHNDPTPVVRCISQMRVPHNYVVDVFLRQLFAKQKADDAKYEYVSDVTNYVAVTAFPPPSISCITDRLISQIDAVMDGSVSVFDTVSVWCSWVDIFGYQAFVQELLDRLLYRTHSVYYIDSGPNVFTNVASILSVVVDSDKARLETTLSAIYAVVETDVDTPVLTQGFAELLVTMICLCDPKYGLRVQLITDECLRRVQSQSESPIMRIFAMNVVKYAVSSSVLRRFVSIDAAQTLTDYGETDAVLQYFSGGKNKH